MLCLITTLALSAPASACLVRRDFAIGDMAEADVIFTGSVRSYEVFSRDDLASIDAIGLIKVDVAESLKGDISGQVELFWSDGSAGLPREIETIDPALFAADKMSQRVRSHHKAFDAVSDRDAAHLQLFAKPCSDPFIVPIGNGDVAKIASSVRGNADWDEISLAPLNYSSDLQKHSAKIYSTSPKTMWLKLAILLISIGVIALSWLFIKAMRKGSASKRN